LNKNLFKENDMNITLNDKLLYLVAGTTIGTAIGMLLAPSSGEELRNNLTSRTREGLDKITDKMGEGRRNLEESELGKKASQSLHNVVEKGRNVANIGRQRINESIEAGKAKFNEAWDSDEYREPGRSAR